MSTTLPIEPLVSDAEMMSMAESFIDRKTDLSVDSPKRAHREVLVCVFGEEVRKLYEAERAELIRQRAVPKWISVEERLPEVGQHIIATDGKWSAQMYYGHYNNDPRTVVMFRSPSGIGSGDPITHWMPLPSPPNR